MEEGNTYLEDFIQSVELLPNDVRRDFELMRVLDRECTESQAQLQKMEKEFLEYVKCGDDASKEFCERPEEKEKIASRLQSIEVLRKKLKQKLAEKTAIATTINIYIDNYTKKLDADLASFEEELRRTGEFTAVSGIEPGSDVAIRPNHLTSEWILGRVIYHDADTGAYDVVDVDDSKVLRLPETQVVALDGANLESVRRLAKNDEVLVVYPDTSTFYPAILTQAPRRGSFMGVEPTALVQFAGDEPDITTGIIAPKSVPLNHVIRPPMW